MRSRQRALLFGAAIGAGLLGAAAPLWAHPAVGADEPLATAPSEPALSQEALRETRWLPWLGCWELVADAVDYREVEGTGERVVCVAPRPDGLGVALTTHVDGLVVAEDTVLADGGRQPWAMNDCEGFQSATWSDDGYRLRSSADLACEGGEQRVLAGLSMLVEDGRWLELQSMAVDGGEHRELMVRYYERLDDAELATFGYAALDPALAGRAATARAGARGPLDIDDVIEAAGELPAEIVEAAIVESNSMFELDRDALFRLADAGIDETVIDLMVAVSFPEEFVVDSGRDDDRGYGGTLYYGGRYGYYGGYHTPLCGAYGYRYSSWFTPFGYGRYGGGCGYGSYGAIYPYNVGPIRGSGPRIDVGVPASGSRFGGRVIKGRGYATVSPREPAGGGSGNVFRRGSSISSGRGSGKSGSGVSSDGYRSGGSSSSSGSSGGGTAKRKAKPRGGGG